MKNEIMYITKANGLIEAKYLLNVEEQRLILYLTSLITPSDKEFKEYFISVSDFCTLVGIRRDSAYECFLKMSESLISRTLKIREGNAVTTISWLAQSTYYKGEGKVSLVFAPKLTPYLLSLKEKFTRYSLENVLKLRSIFSIRIYELLKQYEKLRIREFEVEELKEILGVEDKYTRYYDFRKNTIMIAHKELKEKCDIYFEFEEIKKGRNIGIIKFKIYKNNIELNTLKRVSVDELEPINQEFSDDSQCIEKVRTIITENISDSEILSIWTASEGNLELINNRYSLAKERKEIDNLVGFMVWACKETDVSFVKKNVKKGTKFDNYEGRNVDYEALEKKELEYLYKLYK